MTVLEELAAGVTTATTEQTEGLGIRIARGIPDNVAVALTGDLGSGKTTLVRGIARGLGITRAVTSPTYNIYTIYRGKRQLVHMDAYRLSSPHDLDSLGIDELLTRPFLMAVEWPEHIPGFLEDYRVYALKLSLAADGRHEIKLVSTPD